MMNDNQLIEIIGAPVIEPKVELSPVLYKQYKLRRKSTGLYSTGGSSPRWSEKGKTWNTLAALSGHLSRHKESYAPTKMHHYYWQQTEIDAVGITWNDVEIVVVEVRENKAERIECTDYVKKMAERREKRVIAGKKRQAKNDHLRAIKQLQMAEEQFEHAKKKIEEFKK